jgi:alginate O-acetyltransferase complex protein AlgI
MLFNSYSFIFEFLPVVLIAFYLVGRLSELAAIIWLAGASLIFYWVGNAQFLPLLATSITLNYAIGYLLLSIDLSRTARFAALWIGIGADLVLLSVFKYAGFFAANVNTIFGTSFVVNILLPVGISFYTFTQIAFLVDAYRCNVVQYRLPYYVLFVTYFPHLIAGPILHHKDMIGQFERLKTKRFDTNLLICGILIFSIGLFKKTCLADTIQPMVASAFGAASPTFVEAWTGALSYTYQLYFDFSGYSDMAIGMSLMFGIFLPLNFDSPYRATNIIDFWRRWHMTLSRFLRDYLYIPLGGNRRGPTLRYINLMITMLLGGLWHGASWTFVIWGALHGAYLCVNHAWNYLKSKSTVAGVVSALLSVPLTFLCVVVAWVFFRAENLHSALTVLSSMSHYQRANLTNQQISNFELIGLLAAITWLAPNTQQMLGYDHEQRVVGEHLASPVLRRLLLYGGGAALALGLIGIHQQSEFIYFRF